MPGTGNLATCSELGKSVIVEESPSHHFLFFLKWPSWLLWHQWHMVSKVAELCCRVSLFCFHSCCHATKLRFLHTLGSYLNHTHARLHSDSQLSSATLIVPDQLSPCVKSSHCAMWGECWENSIFLNKNNSSALNKLSNQVHTHTYTPLLLCHNPKDSTRVGRESWLTLWWKVTLQSWYACHVPSFYAPTTPLLSPFSVSALPWALAPGPCTTLVGMLVALHFNELCSTWPINSVSVFPDLPLVPVLLALILTRIYLTATGPGFYKEVGKRFRFETAQHPRLVNFVGRLLNYKYPSHNRSHPFCFLILYVGFSEMRPPCLAQFDLRLTILTWQVAPSRRLRILLF